jgi:UDP:flavonoid glycosyltransferase YjiC (YdhE family)
MVPLAWALRAAGHEVLVGTTGEAVTAGAHAGLPVVDVAPGFDREAMLARMRREQPDRMREMLHRRIDDLRQVAERFSRLSGVLADGVVALAESWRPDLIVQSQLQGAGLVAAGKLDIPVIEHGFGLARTDGMPALHRQHMAGVFDRHGVAALPERYAVIDVAPPSMLDGPPQGWPMR